MLRTYAYGNPDLKPEPGSEMEVGFDLGMLHGRLGVELTYYDKRMHDLLVAQAVPASTGWRQLAPTRTWATPRTAAWSWHSPARRCSATRSTGRAA